MDQNANEGITDDVYKSVSKMVLSECRAEYDELCTTWSSLDTKAQGTVAIASALLGGLLVFLRFNYDHSDQSLSILIFVILAMVLIITSLAWALFALLVREVACMDGAAPVLEAARLILNASNNEQAKKELRDFVLDHADRWQEINADLHRDNNKKSHRVARAQQFILAGIAASGNAILFSLVAKIEIIVSLIS
ncbi:MAG: hypothetical protein Tsb0027_02350 [Wenzhouxiangellaceae bacterium]